jgi:hypothetical protein
MSADFGGFTWAIVVVLGFVVLGVAIAVAKARNRVSPEQERRTERATRDMYETGGFEEPKE